VQTAGTLLAQNGPWESTMKHRRQFLHRAAAAAVLPAVSRVAWAQAYPTRPVRIVVGFTAGSSDSERQAGVTYGPIPA
jgi:hypothetical protein